LATAFLPLPAVAFPLTAVLTAFLGAALLGAAFLGAAFLETTFLAGAALLEATFLAGAATAAATTAGAADLTTFCFLTLFWTLVTPLEADLDFEAEAYLAILLIVVIF
jgi:hypothetical protein